MTDGKLIKSMSNRRFSVELQQIEDRYYVISEDSEGMRYSQPIVDYRIASDIFDETIRQLEGQ